ncbi:hypothetical protein JCM3766R1_006325 [Sporobolomyces carnicolor]
MTSPAPFNLPGYLWDGNRFYKAPPGHTTTSPPASTRRDQTQTAQPSRPAPAPSNDNDRPTFTRTSTKTTLHRQLSDLCLESWTSPSSSLHHDIQGHALARFESTTIVYPDCLPNDENIVKLSFDDRDNSILRIGGSSGTIASGNLSGRTDQSDAYYPNDEFAFRTNWFAPNRITSLETCRDRVLATSLGPPAQAIISTTTNTISMASVTLSPRKTSLWTSAITSNLIALGCDTKVLISTSPERSGGGVGHDSPMEMIETGSRSFGDGTVFSLDLYDDLVFAGLRKGCAKMFDRRIRHPSARNHKSRNELEILIASPVTNLRVLREDPNRIIVAGMNGSLGVYDLRFPRETKALETKPSRPNLDRHGGQAAARRGGRGRGVTTTKAQASPIRALTVPVTTFEGHSNSFSSDLGFDTFRDQFVAAAGQDGKIRVWSLRTGGRPLVSPSTARKGGSHDMNSSTTGASRGLSRAVLSALESLPRDSRATPVVSMSSSRERDSDVSPWSRTFEAPVKSIKFSGSLEPSVAMSSSRRRLEEEGSGNGRGRGEERRPKSFWVADGAGIECFGLK